MFKKLLIAGAAMFAGLAILWFGLKPFRRLRASLADVHVRRSGQVEGAFPTEVQPLVDDLNALLRDREKATARAITTAGDLAHGLKTPLALLRQEAERAAAAGHGEIAENIAEQVERMARQIDYHLARARAAAAGASGNARCPALERALALERTVSKIHAHRGLRIEVRLPKELQFGVQPEDFDEMLGNLLDNACKWARAEIAVRAEGAELIVEDDGAGIPEHLRAAVLARGVMG